MGGAILHNAFFAESNVIDDSMVCLADVLQRVNHHIYYVHHPPMPLLVRVTLEGVRFCDCVSSETAADKAFTGPVVQQSNTMLLSGTGANPPEHMLLEDVRYEDDEIWGMRAFCQAWTWMAKLKPGEEAKGLKPSYYASECRRILNIPEGDDLSACCPATFDLESARKRLWEAVREPTYRAYWPVTLAEGMGVLCRPFGGAALPKWRKSGGPHAGLCLECGVPNKPLFACVGCSNVWFCSHGCRSAALQNGHQQLCVPV